MCTHDPRIYKNLPIGMYHCPECGEMVIAGLEHQPPEDDMSASDDEIMAFCFDIITGRGGLHDFERHELAVPKVNRDVAIAAWVIRCLGNGGADAGAVVAAINERRAKKAPTPEAS